MKITLVTAAAAVLGAAVLAAQSSNSGGREVQFSAREIGTGLRGGYQVIVTDLNRDGKPDIIALASGMPELVWYQNPSWDRHVIAGGMSGMINVSAYDIDGDGIPELALAQGFSTNAKTSTGIVSIVTHGADVTAPWTVKEIDRIPTSHRLRWIDADGSGKKWLVNAPLIGPDSVAPDYKSPVAIAFYRPPDFKRETVTDALSGLIHGIDPVAWPNVKGQVLLSAGFMGIHLHRFVAGKWDTTNLTKGDPQEWPKSGTSDVALGRLGSTRIIGTIEPWHGNEVVVYTESGSGWSRRQIDDGITDGHAIVVVDIDNDGRDEFVVGQRGGAKSLMLYQASSDGMTWSKRAIDEGGMAGAGCAAADFNGDKRMDLVCIGTSTANVKVYENRGK
jgi:aldos-2-ulose dehydratase/isomerase family protein/VCBS repeat protein